MKKVLITGSKGQLGKSLEKAGKEFPEYTILSTDIEELDISDKQALQVFLSDNEIDFIVNCAAYTAVDKAENEKEFALKINATAVKYLAEYSADKNIPLVHISTDYVFDGKNYMPYKESDTTIPSSYYGQTKLAGEEEAINHAFRAVIIRTSWLYSEYGHNFLKSILKFGKEKDELRVVYDQIGTPTYAGDLANAIFQILSQIRNQKTGIYHYGNEGAISWYDFAKAIMEISGIDCEIIPIESKEYPLPAPRPHFSVMNKKKIKDTFGITIPYWKDSLVKCITNLKDK